jgi:DNA-binding NarL/FixJ family response regulator
MSAPIRIYLIDDHPTIIDGLKTALSDVDDMVVVGASTRAKDGLDDVMSHLNDIDVLITDYEMPDIRGDGVGSTVKKSSDHIKVVFYTGYNTDMVYDRCRKAKADAFLYKNAGYEEIRMVIRNVHAGKQMLTAPDRRGLKNNFPRVNLTTTEILIVKLVCCKFMTTNQIADYLSRSPHTIETHRKNIMEALDIHTVQELVHFAINSGYCADEQ